MDSVIPNMRRSYNRRSAEERVADLERKIAELKAKQVAREKKDDPVLRESQKLLQRLKNFVQLALDNNRPDIANSTLGFKAMLERTIQAELGADREEEADLPDDEE
jgi:phage shock protein A